ncbi:pyridoxamine 5'-phosphate oxidase family protein [Isoptericola croceus]|uniref:pyridoxamine 5'-phosphate oxidase family protein n=1 Tax=Isoptericola croceus TaxID=3031406 RepID=UPI0023F9242E|nr:pyridoxamine 5'-phosphate oxidase family protein [Isoptericola croceus]
MTAQTVEKLTEDECWELLRTQPVGRLATAVAGEPDIFPVSFAAADGHVYFRTYPGSKLVEVAVNARVAFEADEWTPEVATSVVVKGTAEILEHDADVAAAEATGLVSYLDDGKNVWVRIVPEALTGRRLTR